MILQLKVCLRGLELYRFSKSRFQFPVPHLTSAECCHLSRSFATLAFSSCTCSALVLDVAQSSDQLDVKWFLLALKHIQILHVKRDGASFSPNFFSVLLSLSLLLSLGRCSWVQEKSNPVTSPDADAKCAPRTLARMWLKDIEPEVSLWRFSQSNSI